MTVNLTAIWQQVLTLNQFMRSQAKFEGNLSLPSSWGIGILYIHSNAWLTKPLTLLFWHVDYWAFVPIIIVSYLFDPVARPFLDIELTYSLSRWIIICHFTVFRILYLEKSINRYEKLFFFIKKSLITRLWRLYFSWSRKPERERT